MKIYLQNTVAKEASLTGIGLHSGKPATLTLKPAGANMGFVFIRTDVKDKESKVEANFKNVVKTMLGTTIANEAGVEVLTVEHLMAGLWGAGIDNAIIEIDGPEIPIMDGSSAPFMRLVAQAGIKSLGEPRKVIRILDEIKVGDESKWAILRPSKSFKVKFDIDFDDDAIAHQVAKFDFGKSSFATEIASARTFCMKKDVDTMRANGLARGGSLENAIVVDEGKILNQDGLRFENEFVRHKILDSVGDLFLAGAHIQGEFVGVKSGHKLNNQILRAMADNPNSFEIVTPQAGHGFGFGGRPVLA
jgi:UDP-3-O-[3-hydroxymyristoyl] N-acetylglucosamine deacetylase